MTTHTFVSFLRFPDGTELRVLTATRSENRRGPPKYIHVVERVRRESGDGRDAVEAGTPSAGQEAKAAAKRTRPRRKKDAGVVVPESENESA